MMNVCVQFGGKKCGGFINLDYINWDIKGFLGKEIEKLFINLPIG